MLFVDAKTDYLNYILNERGLSRKTHTTYQSWLNRYTAFVEAQGHPGPDAEMALSILLLRKYQYSLSRLRPRTVRAAFHPLRGLSGFLIENGLLTEDPTRKLTLPKKDAAIRLLVSDDEITALLEATERQCDPRKVAFSRSLFSALIYTGLRASECLEMKIEDVKVDDETLLVPTGKGNKSRLLYPPPEFFIAYREWLAERKKMGCNHSWVWAQDSRRRISYDWMRSWLAELAAVAGHKGAENIRCHSLRHWFATHLHKQGATIKQVQTALGHANANTTFDYLHIDEDDCNAMAALASFNPKPAAVKPVSADTPVPSRHPVSDRVVTRFRRQQLRREPVGA